MVKQEVSPAVSLSLSINPGWGEFEMDINQNKVPVAFSSTPVIPRKLAESITLLKKEVTTVGSKFETSSSEESEKAGLPVEGVDNADQVLVLKTKLVSMAGSLRKLADELLSLVESA
uniref:Uncharacterized protein n=1 Tax=Ditylenchus dipsaci TaxID=166011 RepID=A0A915EAT3_9BILA